MNFDQAFKLMREGQALARPNWKECLFWFYQHGRLWKLSRAGHVRVIGYVNEGFISAEDWRIVEGVIIPILPEPKVETIKPRRKLADSLKRKQEQMRQRYGTS